MNSDAHDCCRCSGKMKEGKHDFMARAGNEIVVVKDVPALVCDTCGGIEYTLEVSKRDRCDHEGILCRTTAGKASGDGGDPVQASAGGHEWASIACRRIHAKSNLQRRSQWVLNLRFVDFHHEGHEVHKEHTEAAIQKGFETDAEHRGLLDAEKLVRSRR